jgi:hypothetical protein
MGLTGRKPRRSQSRRIWKSMSHLRQEGSACAGGCILRRYYAHRPPTDAHDAIALLCIPAKSKTPQSHPALHSCRLFARTHNNTHKVYHPATSHAPPL